MTGNAWLNLALLMGALLLLARPLGGFMADIYNGRIPAWIGWLKPLERGIHRVAGIDSDQEMGWKGYAAAFLASQGVGILLLMILLMMQGVLPLNPAGFGGVSWHLAFNTAVSFVTNTNWQSYGGETTLSYLTQSMGLTVQNFISAAAGMAVIVALARGFSRRLTDRIGNYWVDLVRGVLYILLPLSLILALILVSQGVVQTFGPYVAATDADGYTQLLARGPAASQVAIKQLGTNGGGFFNVNSAHPFENPTPLSNFLQMLSILLIPMALGHTWGRMVGSVRQGWALIAAMTILFLPCAVGTTAFEQAPNSAWHALGIDDAAGPLQSGGNMEGKEVRHGIVASTLWATATTAASNGSVNAMHDSFTPLGGLVPMWLMQLGEVVYGGTGSGLYGMILMALVAVFIAGLMVGRTPEYLGKKIEAHEMKMTAIGILAPSVTVLMGTAIAVATSAGLAGLLNHGPHGFGEILYAWTSAANNNGSAFAGLTANTPFYNVGLGVAMLCGRYAVAIPVLAMAGSLAAKKLVPASSGTLPTHGLLFILLLVGVVLLVGALTFLPALALGPVVEHLMRIGG